MAKNIKFNVKAFEEIRRLPEVDQMLSDVVKDIEADIGDAEGYKSAVGRGKTRSRGTVWTAEAEAIVDNEKYNSLLTALSNAWVGR